jgi:hypothetical protein
VILATAAVASPLGAAATNVDDAGAGPAPSAVVADALDGAGPVAAVALVAAGALGEAGASETVGGAGSRGGGLTGGGGED